VTESHSSLVPPSWPNNIGKVRRIKSIEGNPVQFTVMDEILQPETDFPQKLICFQRVQMEPGGIGLRLGYYILGWKESRRGMWVWGQYATFLDPKDLAAVIKTAQSRGWFE
jgi:hypothetical protein